MKRYRVESRNKNNYFRADCTEDELEYWKALCKFDALKNNGTCYYREFPVTKNPKVYYAKNNSEMTVSELEVIKTKINI